MGSVCGPYFNKFAATFCIISGILNDPPISTNWPRDTITSLPSANSFSDNKTAAALLLTTIASSAPVIEDICAEIWFWRCPRLPVSRFNSKLTYPESLFDTTLIIFLSIGALPRPVWRMIPVALITGFILETDRFDNFNKRVISG